jgi:hypothetical protein
MMTPVQQQQAEQLAAWKLATILFLLSFATVVFTIVLFRLLTFFIMPSLFFDLLFIGFPLGALAGVYFFVVSRPSFLKTLWILQGTMLFSILAMLACKHFDYLRAHLFDVELQRLFLQMLIFTLFFLPFFIAYGLSEYIGYQIGRRHLRGRMPMVYAIYLFGAAGAYLFAEFMFPNPVSPGYTGNAVAWNGAAGAPGSDCATGHDCCADLHTSARRRFPEALQGCQPPVNPCLRQYGVRDNSPAMGQIQPHRNHAGTRHGGLRRFL